MDTHHIYPPQQVAGIVERGLAGWAVLNQVAFDFNTHTTPTRIVLAIDLALLLYQNHDVDGAT